MTTSYPFISYLILSRSLSNCNVTVKVMHFLKKHDIIWFGKIWTRFCPTRSRIVIRIANISFCVQSNTYFIMLLWLLLHCQKQQHQQHQLCHRVLHEHHRCKLNRTRNRVQLCLLPLTMSFKSKVEKLSFSLRFCHKVAHQPKVNHQVQANMSWIQYWSCFVRVVAVVGVNKRITQRNARIRICAHICHAHMQVRGPEHIKSTQIAIRCSVVAWWVLSASPWVMVSSHWQALFREHVVDLLLTLKQSLRRLATLPSMFVVVSSLCCSLVTTRRAARANSYVEKNSRFGFEFSSRFSPNRGKIAGCELLP